MVCYFPGNEITILLFLEFSPLLFQHEMMVFANSILTSVAQDFQLKKGQESRVGQPRLCILTDPIE